MHRTVTVGERVCVGRLSDLLHEKGRDTLDERGSYGGTVLLRGLEPSYRCRPGTFVLSNPLIPNEDLYSRQQYPFVEAYLIHHQSLSLEVFQPFYRALTWVEEDIIERPRYIGRYDWGDWSEGKDAFYFLDMDAVDEVKAHPEVCAEEEEKWDQLGAIAVLKNAKGFKLMPAMEYKYGMLFLNEQNEVEGLLLFDRYCVYDHGSLALNTPFDNLLQSDPTDKIAQQTLRLLQLRPWETRDADLSLIMQTATGLAAEALLAEYAAWNLRHFKRLLQKCYLEDNPPDDFLWGGDLAKRESNLLAMLETYLPDDIVNDPDWLPWMAEDLQFETADDAVSGEDEESVCPVEDGGQGSADIASGIQGVELDDDTEDEDYSQFTLADWADWVHPTDWPWEYDDMELDEEPEALDAEIPDVS